MQPQPTPFLDWYGIWPSTASSRRTAPSGRRTRPGHRADPRVGAQVRGLLSQGAPLGAGSQPPRQRHAPHRRALPPLVRSPAPGEPGALLCLLRRERRRLRLAAAGAGPVRVRRLHPQQHHQRRPRPSPRLCLHRPRRPARRALQGRRPGGALLPRRPARPGDGRRALQGPAGGPGPGGCVGRRKGPGASRSGSSSWAQPPPTASTGTTSAPPSSMPARPSWIPTTSASTIPTRGSTWPTCGGHIDRRRLVRRVSGPRFESLAEPRPCLLPDPLDALDDDIYNPCYTPYPGTRPRYLMFPSIYHRIAFYGRRPARGQPRWPPMDPALSPAHRRPRL